ncbi:MAG: type IV toxin-antitoxin system AbiEi family antitoxin domain-containing protein [Chloroflexota bacterium]
MTTTYAQTQGMRLIRAVAEANGPIFTLEQAREQAKPLGISLRNVPQTLSKLVRAGWIARLKRGVYVLQPPFADAPQHPFALATALVSPVAISHWSALVHHGLTTQIPMMVQASTPKKVVTPEMRHGVAYAPRGHPVWRALDVEIEFFHTPVKHFFGFQDVWVSRWNRVPITDPERTLLDMVAHPARFGGTAFAIETLAAHHTSLDIPSLTSYALQYGVVAVIKRLGWILENLGGNADTLRPLLEYPVHSRYLLDPRRSPKGISIPQWHLVNNLLEASHD